MNLLFKITFKKLRSPNYTKAYYLAGEFETRDLDFYGTSTITTTYYEINERKNTYEQLIGFIHRWQDFSMTCNGEKVDPYYFINSLARIDDCKKEAMHEGILNHCPKLKTKEGFGCKFIHYLHLEEPNYFNSYNNKMWYHIGNFDDYGRFIINKQEIINSAVNQLKSTNAIHCDLLDMNLITLKINNLPDVISFGRDSKFEKVYSGKPDRTTGKRIPIGVKPKKKKEDEYHTSMTLNLDDLDDMIDDAVEEQLSNLYESNFKFIKPSFGLELLKGIENVKDSINRQFLNPIKFILSNPSKGLPLPHFLILYGKPGVGKTTLAEAISNTISENIISCNGSDFLEAYIGASEKKLTMLFSIAKEKQPCTIIINEIESLLPDRLVENINLNLTNHFIGLVDGLEVTDEVFVIGTTNHFNKIDEAALRPGRLNSRIEVNNPDINGIVSMLTLKFEDYYTSDFNYDFIASLLLGMTGAQIYNFINTVIIQKEIKSVSSDRLAIQTIDFINVLKEILGNDSFNQLI